MKNSYRVLLGAVSFLASLNVWAAAPVKGPEKGKDCPDIAKQLSKLDAIEQERIWVGATDVTRVAQGPLSLPEAYIIHSAFESRNSQPTVKWVKPKSIEQVGCKSVAFELAEALAAGQHKMTFPIIKYTRNSVTVDQLGGFKSSKSSDSSGSTDGSQYSPNKIHITMQFKENRVEMSTDTHYENYPLYCQNKIIGKSVSLGQNMVFLWSSKPGVAPQPVPATENFKRLAREAEPIVNRFHADCQRSSILDGGVTLPATESDGAKESRGAADGGMTPAN